MVAQLTLTREQVDLTSDPLMLDIMAALPNPDPILRRLGASDDIYQRILYDAHVIGELGSISSSLLSYEWKIEPGGDSADDMRAWEACQRVFSRKPAPNWRWPDLIWHAYTSVLRGYSVSELVWGASDGLFLPIKILPRPQRRFTFTADHNLKVLTKTNSVDGEDTDALKYLITRHRPEPDNPYGVAVLSACFWPWTFKHAGFKFFAKFSEKYGLPWAIAQYQVGSGDYKTIESRILDQLQNMIEDAIAAVPEGTKVDLVESSSGHADVHEKLINLCDRQMSKALTSQTLGAQIDGQGSRAATETHQARQVRLESSILNLVADHFTQCCEHITRHNYPSAKAPWYEFIEEAEARSDWVEVFNGANELRLPVPEWFAYQRLNIPRPEPGEPTLGQNASQAQAEFATQQPGQRDLLEIIDRLAPGDGQQQIEQIVNPLLHHIQRVGPEEALTSLGEMYPDMDNSQLRRYMAQIMFIGEMVGRVSTDATAD